jgi:hypothetical protein
MQNYQTAGMLPTVMFQNTATLTGAVICPSMEWIMIVISVYLTTKYNSKLNVVDSPFYH